MMNFAISGPSGVGKSTLAKMIQDEGLGQLNCSYTTRKKRADEEEGKDYCFVTKEVFLKMIEENQFLEYTQSFEDYYGILAKTIKEATRPILFVIDVSGVYTLKKIPYFPLKTIMILPPSIEELEKRLYARKTESREKVEARLERAKKELEYKDDYDKCIVNNHLENAHNELKEFIIHYGNTKL